MKKKLTSAMALCVTASLIITTAGITAFGEEPTYEEPTYEEPTYVEPTYEEPSYEEPSYEEPVSTGRSLVSVETVYDCDGSGNGYYIYYYSDGSEEYEDFYASSSSGSSSGSSDSGSYNNEGTDSEEVTSEDVEEEDIKTEETEKNEQDEAENIEIEYDGIEWTMEQIDSFSDVLTGVDDKEYSVGDASKYDIHKSVNYDSDIIKGVLFNTVNMKGDTAGDYDVMYFIYFDREALIDYIDKQDLNEEDFPGLTDESSNVVEVGVRGTVVVN